MFDFHQGVSDPDGEYDEGRIDDYSNDLLIAFNASDEAQLLSDRQNWSQLMLEYGFSHVGVSPAKMTRRDFEEVLFEIFPRKVSTGADQTESIIAELRAFWTFAARQFAARNHRRSPRTFLRRRFANPPTFAAPPAGTDKHLVASA